MGAEILHVGFDGLKVTVQADIPLALQNQFSQAKTQCRKTNSECIVQIGDTAFSMTPKGARGFACHTGDLGAVWMFQDPLDRVPHNPGIIVDFRAFGLATGGLGQAEDHFRRVTEDLRIRYSDQLMRISRVDVAVDMLAPWFEPDRTALVVPPGTKVTEYTGIDETATQATGARVTGLRAGAVSNRQLAIYDKRLEVMKTGKLGWLEIWNKTRNKQGNGPLNLRERDKSLVWRFELRLGSKQLRNQFELHSWDDLRAGIGDAYRDAFSRIRYCSPTQDTNRSRWPSHELWRKFSDTVQENLADHSCGLVPTDIIYANKLAKIRQLDAQLMGLFLTRAAISDVQETDLPAFMERHEIGRAHV